MPSHSSLYDLKMLIVHHSPDIPILPRQMYAIHRLQMDWDCCSSCSFLHTYPHGPGLVHRYISFELYGHFYQLAPMLILFLQVCYSLGIYLLNLFLAFLQPKFDPSLTQDEGLEDGDASQPTLPTKQDEEFRPFIRRLPEFKFWHSSTRAIAIAFFCTWWGVFNVPVFWPVLVVYFIILFSLTSKCCYHSQCL